MNVNNNYYMYHITDYAVANWLALHPLNVRGLMHRNYFSDHCICHSQTEIILL